MLYVEITIKDEMGNVVLPTQRGPASQPITWKSPPGHPAVIERGGDNGAYLLWHYQWQPGITLNLQYKQKPLG